MSIQPAGVGLASGGLGAAVFEALRQVASSSTACPIVPPGLDSSEPDRSFSIDPWSFTLGLCIGLLLIPLLDLLCLGRCALRLALQQRGIVPRPVGWFRALDG